MLARPNGVRREISVRSAEEIQPVSVRDLDLRPLTERGPYTLRKYGARCVDLAQQGRDRIDEGSDLRTDFGPRGGRDILLIRA